MSPSEGMFLNDCRAEGAKSSARVLRRDPQGGGSFPPPQTCGQKLLLFCHLLCLHHHQQHQQHLNQVFTAVLTRGGNCG